MNGSTALFHIQCFTCEECQQVLVDLKAFLHSTNDRNDRSKVKNSLYCSRHFVELFKPRCQFCDHLIFDEECTEAEGKAWHLGHFCCSECKRSLGGQQYIMADPSKQSDKKLISKSQSLPQNRDKQFPYCLTCFDILFGELCEECGELIGCDVGAISHEGRSWHASDHCFKCNLCFKTLLGKPFLPAFDGRIYCSITCSQEAIQRNKYRNRRKQKPPINGNSETIYGFNNNIDLKTKPVDSQSEEQSKPVLKIRENQQIFADSHKPSEERLKGVMISENQINGLPNHKLRESEEINSFAKKINEIELNQNQKTTNCHSRPPKPKDYHSFENRNSQNIRSCEQMSANDMINKQMTQYLQNQPPDRPPNQILDFMRYQVLQNGINGNNHIIGAAIEYGSSYSEDERTNQLIIDTNKTQTPNDINYNPMTSMTSSTSSSLSANPFEANPFQTNPLKPKPSLIHSSSSNETTPLLLRSLEERAKHLTQIQSQSQQMYDNCQVFEKQLQSLPKSGSSSQTASQASTQADQSSISSYIESNGRNNDSIQMKVTPDLKETGVDSPSTQSTALQSTSSQTTPETNPRSANKSVTFDPNVKETTGRRLNRKPKARPTKTTEWSDNEWCSTCSSCSSSSSDDNFDYESTLERNRNQWLGGTKIHYVTHERKKSNSNLMQQNPNNSQNESCIIA